MQDIGTRTKIVGRFTRQVRAVRHALASLLWLAPLSLFAITLRQENFESATDGTNYTVLGEHGTNSAAVNQYFKRGGNTDFALGQAMAGLHGSNFWGGEDTDLSGPGECNVTLGAVDVRGFQNLRVTWALGIGRDAAFGGTPYESADYMILQAALNAGAWTNLSIFRGPAGSGYLQEDTNQDGIGNGTTLTHTFADFQYLLSSLGTGLQVRALLLMSSTSEEALFDDIRITGDAITPSITITNPATNIVVGEAVTNYDVQGTANFGVVWNIVWTNGLTGLTGTIPASTNWTIPGLSLGAGVNTITVIGTNTVGSTNTASVQINRVLLPVLSITSPPASTNVPDTAVAVTVNGTANAFVSGLLRWTNNLTGGSGTSSASTNWSIPGIPLALGTNLITVTGTNILQQSTNASVSVYCVPVPTLTITNPANGTAVAHDVLVANLSGTAGGEIFDLLRWTNNLTGGSGSATASTSWSILNIPLGLGTNAIVVSGSNIVGRANTATVQVYRVDAPLLSITNPATFSAVSDLVTSTTLSGTANGVVGGLLRWTNNLTGGSGSGPASTSWSLAGIALNLGTNTITVTASNSVNRSTNATVNIYRVPVPTLAITNPANGTAVAHDVLATNLSGTAGGEIFGLLRWTNNLTGGSGSATASTSWSILNIPLGLGTNAIIVTGSNIVGRANTATVQVYRVDAPLLSITNPATFSAVSDLVTNTTLSGTANDVVGGLLRWTNNLTGGSGSGPASTSWSLAGIALNLGTNTITVTASNIVSRSTNATVNIYRIPAPTLTITDPSGPVTLANSITSRQVGGTANAVVSGLITWSNALTGATGTTPAGTNWLAAALPIVPGINTITVRATNQVGRLASAQVTVAREGAVLLNEVLVNPVGLLDTNDFEFIELLQVAGGGSATNLSVIEISGNLIDRGFVYGRWNLDGLAFGTNGLLLVGDNYNTTAGGSWSNHVSPHTGLGDADYVPATLQNTSITLLLVQNCLASVFVGADLDLDNNGILDGAPWGALLDGVGWRDGDVGDSVYVPATLAQTSDWPDGASRLQTNRVPQDASAWFNGDVITTGGDPLGKTYNAAIASTNFPSGGVLTPGRPNYPFPYDQDGDGLPNTWEQQYFGGTTNGAPNVDSDGDGQSNQAEYWAGTDPTSAAAFFMIDVFASTGTVTIVETQETLTVTGHLLQWDSLSNRIYSVFGRTNVAGPYGLIQGGLPATPPINTYPSTLGTNRTFFYRIGVMEPVYP